MSLSPYTPNKHLTLLLRSSTLLLPAHNKKRHLFRCLAVARQRPTLAGGSLQLPSAQKSLTAVFGMGTGVTSLPLSPDSTSDKLRISSLKGIERIGDSFKTKSEIDSIVKNVYRISPRPISISPLHVSPRFHF